MKLPPGVPPTDVSPDDIETLRPCPVDTAAPSLGCAWCLGRGLVSTDNLTRFKLGLEPQHEGIMDAIKYTPATFFSKASRTTMDLVVIHSAECAEVSNAAENLAAWGGGPNANKASWRYAIDNDSITQSVLEKDVAWHAGPVNNYSIGIEHAGRASQTAEQWADDYSLAMLERSAELVADICRRYSIPIRRLSAADLKRGERREICGHVDVTMGLAGGKGHVDPGPAFPWDWYLERVASYGGAAAPPAPTPTADVSQFVRVTVAGIAWLVSPAYYAPVGIGQAKAIADALGLELPSPALVDAIWRASDLKVPPDLMIRTHDGVHMDTPELHEEQRQALEKFLAGRSLGVDFSLIAGCFKDVINVGGRLGIYGWHADNEAAKVLGKKRIPTYAPETPGSGVVVQQPGFRHSLDWRDYSQGLRLVRRA